jgi:hypothetical protein
MWLIYHARQIHRYKIDSLQHGVGEPTPERGGDLIRNSPERKYDFGRKEGTEMSKGTLSTEQIIAVLKQLEADRPVWIVKD